MTDSSTGGYIIPSPKFPVLPGQLTLKEFIQTVLVGISGLPGDLCRPNWQVAPAKQPDITTNWIAFGLTTNKADANAWVGTSSGQYANGFIHFKCSPQPGDTVTVNSVVITFVSTLTSGPQVLLDKNLQLVAQRLADLLTGSVDSHLVGFTYTAFYHDVTITAGAVGTAGNAFTLASSASGVVISGPTLTGGATFNNSMQRHEDLEISCSFIGPDCEALAAEVRDGFNMTQNLETLRLANMGFVGTGDMTHVPDLLNERWVDRIVMSVFLRREIIRSYPVLSFVSASGIIESVVSENLKSIVWNSNP